MIKLYQHSWASLSEETRLISFRPADDPRNFEGHMGLSVTRNRGRSLKELIDGGAPSQQASPERGPRFPAGSAERLRAGKERAIAGLKQGTALEQARRLGLNQQMMASVEQAFSEIGIDHIHPTELRGLNEGRFHALGVHVSMTNNIIQVSPHRARPELDLRKQQVDGLRRRIDIAKSQIGIVKRNARQYGRVPHPTMRAKYDGLMAEKMNAELELATLLKTPLTPVGIATEQPPLPKVESRPLTTAPLDIVRVPSGADDIPVAQQQAPTTRQDAPLSSSAPESNLPVSVATTIFDFAERFGNVSDSTKDDIVVGRFGATLIANKEFYQQYAQLCHATDSQTGMMTLKNTEDLQSVLKNQGNDPLKKLIQTAQQLTPTQRVKYNEMINAKQIATKLKEKYPEFAKVSDRDIRSIEKAIQEYQTSKEDTGNRQAARFKLTYLGVDMEKSTFEQGSIHLVPSNQNIISKILSLANIYFQRGKKQVAPSSTDNSQLPQPRPSASQDTSTFNEMTFNAKSINERVTALRNLPSVIPQELDQQKYFTNAVQNIAEYVASGEDMTKANEHFANFITNIQLIRIAIRGFRSRDGGPQPELANSLEKRAALLCATMRDAMIEQSTKIEDRKKQGQVAQNLRLLEGEGVRFSENFTKRKRQDFTAPEVTTNSAPSSSPEPTDSPEKVGEIRKKALEAALESVSKVLNAHRIEYNATEVKNGIVLTFENPGAGVQYELSARDFSTTSDYCNMELRRVTKYSGYTEKYDMPSYNIKTRRIDVHSTLDKVVTDKLIPTLQRITPEGLAVERAEINTQADFDKIWEQARTIADQIPQREYFDDKDETYQQNFRNSLGKYPKIFIGSNASTAVIDMVIRKLGLQFVEAVTLSPVLGAKPTNVYSATKPITSTEFAQIRALHQLTQFKMDTDMMRYSLQYLAGHEAPYDVCRDIVERIRATTMPPPSGREGIVPDTLKDMPANSKLSITIDPTTVGSMSTIIEQIFGVDSKTIQKNGNTHTLTIKKQISPDDIRVLRFFSQIREIKKI